MARKKREKTAAELMREWHNEHVRPHQVPKPPSDNILRRTAQMDRVTRAQSEGREIVVTINRMMANGKQYKYGDDYDYQPGDDLSKLAMAMYLEDKDHWQRYKVFGFYQDYSRNVLEPKQQLINKSETDVRKAQLYLDTVRAEMMTAETNYRDAVGRLELHEKELHEALELTPEYTARA